MFIWVSCGSWVVGNTTVLQETRFHYAIFGEGIVINKRNRTALFVILFNLFFIVLVACGKDGPGGIATHTPLPSATATCPPNIELSTPIGWKTSSRLLVILFEPRLETMNGQYLELRGGENTHDASYFVSHVLPSLTGPGDHVAIFQLGHDTYSEARVTSLDSYIEVPQLYDTPSPRNTSTPVPTITETPEPGMLAIRATNTARAYETMVTGTQLAKDAIYNCEKTVWNETAGATAVAWNATQTAEASNLGSSIESSLETHKSNSQLRSDAFSTDELYYGSVYYGLHFATLVIEEECNKHDDCVLLIVDDLSVLGRNNPDMLSIDLSSVDVHSIMLGCEDIKQPDCKAIRDYWDVEFVEFGVDPNKITYWNGIHLEQNLIDTIGR
ncbi:hypothetical protein HN803_05050, partial [candidate division WWE3 bacterium]|jgi:hypothetical protein|nr:hypothetical protein [candidate division WWE3 bacterium]